MATLSDLLRGNNPNAVVDDIYRNVLGREATQSDYSWANDLNPDVPTGAIDLARRIAGSEEGRNYALSNPDAQFGYLEAASKENAPTTAFDTSGMQYLGGNSYIDRTGNEISIDENGQAVSYSPNANWYDEQLKSRPDALRNMNYRNQTYLSTGPLQQTINFQGKEIPLSAGEYQVDPRTGQFIKGATGENVPLKFKDPDYDMWADWAGPVAAIAIPVAASYAAPYLLGEGALAAAGATEAGSAAAAGDVFAGYSATGSAAGTAGSTVPAGYGATTVGTAGSAFGPTYGELGYTGLGEGMAGPTYGEMGFTGFNQGEAIAQADAAAKTFGIKDAYNAYKAANSLKNMFGSTQPKTSNGMFNTSTGSNYNYFNQPFLSNPQQKSIYAPTGLDVSGNQANPLDASRGNNLLANLLRR